MNETLILEIIFWSALFMVFYTYLGYGIVLYALVKLKELFVKPVKRVLPPDSDLPEVTLFITAFNEEDVVDEKMENSLALDYPADKLRIVWVTDGSDDGTNDRLQTHWNGKATVYFQPKRQGKTAAMTRGMTLVRTPLVVFTDANTMVNSEAIREIVLAFQNPKVGCVAGEKRISRTDEGRSSRRRRRHLLEIRIDTESARLPSLLSCRRCRRTVCRPPRTLRTDGTGYAARRLHPLSPHRHERIHHRLLHQRLRHRKRIGKYG